MANKLDVKNMTTEELLEELGNAERHFNDLAFSNAVATLDNTSQIRETRKDVARIKTELRARELAEQEANGLQRDRIRARRKRQKKAKK